MKVVNFTPREIVSELDRYIIGKLHVLVNDVRAQMDAYDLFAACGSIRASG